MKRQIFTWLFLIIGLTSEAQEKRNTLYFNVGGGVHNLSYSALDAASKGVFGFTVNGGYNYYLSPNLGIGLGLGISSFNSKCELNSLVTSAAVDIEGASYEHRNYFTNWTEKQSVNTLDIPLGIILRKHIGKNIGLLAKVGAEYSIPIKSTYEVTDGTLRSTGYYSQWNVELENLPQYGFPVLNNKPSGKVFLKNGLSAFVDLGMTLNLAEGRLLYLGGYLNYGISNIAISQSSLPFDGKGVYSSIVNASNAVEKVTPLALGLKIGISLEKKVKN
jgi:hypothetical protein